MQRCVYEEKQEVRGERVENEGEDGCVAVAGGGG